LFGFPSFVPAFGCNVDVTTETGRVLPAAVGVAIACTAWVGGGSDGRDLAVAVAGMELSPTDFTPPEAEDVFEVVLTTFDAVVADTDVCGVVDGT